jgi:phenylalanyl-tRNA synthetase beta chain
VRVVADALEVVGLSVDSTDVEGFRPGRAARVVAGASELGVVGEVAGAVLDALGLEPPVVAAELSLDALLDAPRRDGTFRAPSRFPASTVDLAFVLDAAVPAALVQRTIGGAVGDMLEEVRAFDDFRSDALGVGRRSLAFALRFRAHDRTLTDTDVAGLRQRAIDAVTKEHGAQLR